MTFPSGIKVVGTALMFSAVALLCAAGLANAHAFAQQSPAPTQPSRTTPAQSLPVDEFDRNAQLWAMQRVGKSSLERGQEIYYMRCWFCHNEYTIAAELSPAVAAPSLRDLFKRPTLRNGRPVTDESVAAQIRSGGLQMPAYAPANLSDKDLADVLAYLKEKCGTFQRGGGCFDEHNPPLNPRYRAQ